MSLVLLENWVERQDSAGLMGLPSSEGIRCRLCCKQHGAVLRWLGWLGFAGALSLWTALVCADAEGLLWQPCLLLLLLLVTLIKVESILTAGPILGCPTAG